MAKRTRQSILNQVVKGMAAQGFKPSLTVIGAGCSYRGRNGLKCAIGHLIPDDKYRSSIEGFGIAGSTGVRNVLKDCNLPVSNDEDINFLSDLQRCHDEAYRNTRDGKMVSESDSVAFEQAVADSMKERFVLLCKKYKLNAPWEIL